MPKATDKKTVKPGDIIRALRLPFISASLLPFAFGSFIDRTKFNFPVFSLGLLCVACVHLCANLINDYADSKSGVDWLDMKFYGFFGGSKLIQEGVFSEKFYLKLAFIFFCVSLLCALLLSWRTGDIRVLYFYAAILFLSVSYSAKPLALSYRYLGEPVIFALFGPGLCMGGYYLQTGIFPDSKSLLLSLPLGLLVMNVLLANEVPDFTEDLKRKKRNWVSIQGRERTWAVYLAVNAAALFMVAFNVACGFLSPWALLSLFFIPFFLKAGKILKESFLDKQKLAESSRLAIAVHAGVSAVLAIALFL